MKANDYALYISKVNFESSLVSQREQDILDYIKDTVYEIIPKANLYITGSYRAKTNVIGKSDIDVLVALPYPAGGFAADDIWPYLMSLPEYFRNGIKLNIDGYFDPPAYVVEDLEFNNTTKIEITAALTTKAMGGNEYDFYIPNRFCNGLTITNPERRFKVTTHLNKITDNYFSYVTILIKIISERLKLNLPSFAIESFLYYWFRDSYKDCKLNVLKESNELDFTYDPYRYMGILDLYYMTVSALLSMAKEFHYSWCEKKIFKMENPYIEGYNDYVQFCETLDEQEVMSDVLFGFTDFMSSFVHKDKILEEEMEYLFFGENITEPPYIKNNKSYYALRMLYWPLLKNICRAEFEHCKELLSSKYLTPHHFLYFEIMLCLKENVGLLRYALSVAQGAEYTNAFEKIYQYSLEVIKLCSSVAIREKIFGMSEPGAFGDFALELLDLFPRFLADDSVETIRAEVADSILLCKDRPPLILKWEGYSHEFSSCMLRSMDVYKEYLNKENWKRHIINIIPAQT